MITDHRLAQVLDAIHRGCSARWASDLRYVATSIPPVAFARAAAKTARALVFEQLAAEAYRRQQAIKA